ncbi:hypothetical protein GJAV_G00211330 [Gymnothorax javanicus]|nr:hypothetical protein GJAV_G00211330 [Gymnothorax javanicus]
MSMFGNLFEEDEESFSPVPSTRRQGPAAESPPSRGGVRLSGIKNQGGTCYLNSLLQTLFFTPEFREELFSLGPEELGILADLDKPEAKVRVIPLQLQRLFVRLLLVDQQTASTSDLTDSFGWSSSEESSQQDVQELNRILFSALESSLVGTPGSSLIHRLYHGSVVNQIVCKECGNVSERQDDFLDLTVTVKGVCGLEEALWNMFVEEEMFEGNNLYRCSGCDRLVTAAKSAKLRKLPPFLTVSLLRFSFDFTKCERYKETGRYSFPLTINLRPFCQQSEKPDTEFTYELFSVIIHKGGCYGGHYHVYIKDIDQLGHWEAPEEELKLKVQKKEVVQVHEPVVEKDDPLSVLVSILSQEDGKSVLVDQLGQKLLDKIGTSWNRKFRKQFGPLGQFLRKHSESFMLLANGTRVTLKACTPGELVSPSTDVECPMVTEPSEPLPADRTHWFDLNDSTVTPIHERDIEKQFQGKESAYMLFYRKAELRRPEQAKGNPGYRVPPHLLELAQEENILLQQRRSDFDAAKNTIEVRLHLAPQYQLINGALQAMGRGQDSVITLSFDHRRTVGDFRLAVYQMQDLWEGDMALTVAKSLPAGLHLYNTLSDDQQSLYSAGIRDGSDLFVWNGREVSDISQEALYSGWSLCADRGGVGACASDPGAALAGRRGGGRERRWRGGGGGGASSWRVFPAADMHRTLKDLALRDGDALLVLEPQAMDTSMILVNGDIVTVTTPSDCRWLLVEFCPLPERGAAGEQEEGERRRGKVPAAGNMLLSEVKQRAIEELQLQEQLRDVQCCLRQMDSSGRFLHAVREYLSVREAGVKLMTVLFLCHGEAPGPSQLFLYFIVGSDKQEWELIVEESQTVKECLKLIMQLAGLEGEAWHLRKTDWCEEVGDALSEENATMAELKIQSGDVLVVKEGRLPPKGFLKLPVWFYGKHSDRLVHTDSQGNYVTNGVDVQEDEISTTESGADFQFAGEVEISGEASLDDLKTLIMTLPALQCVCVPSPAFLRLWVVEGWRLSKILRGNAQPIKKLKLGIGTELCVQQLLKEENLGPKELLLRVQMGVPGEQQYFPPEEMVWDTSRDSSPRGLYVALGTQFGLSPDCLHIAKHFPEKHSWMPISNWIQQVSKRKKKTESLQGAPFHLKDGDLIGVKNLLIDSNKDFSTLRDHLGQQRLREEAESRRKGGQNGSTEPGQGAGPGKRVAGKSRKPESHTKMEADLLIDWQRERAEVRAELSRLQDELAESRAEKEELRSRAQALTDRMAQSWDPVMSLRQDSEQRYWKKKLREGREREARQAQLIHKLQSKVLEYRARCQGLGHQLQIEERELQKREKKILNEHSNSLESTLIRLEEEQQRCVGLAEMNALLHSQLSQSGKANEDLREDLAKLTSDWSRAVEEAEQKENEWQKEKGLLTSHIGREHARLMSLWEGVVTLRRHYHTLRTATDRDLWELRAEFSRSSSSLLSCCVRFGSSHASGHASLQTLEQSVQQREQEISQLNERHRSEMQELQGRISELSSTLLNLDRERRSQEEEEEKRRLREAEREKERERDWERQQEMERDLQSVQQAVLNLSNFLSSRQSDVRSSTPMTLAELSNGRLPSLLTVIAEAESALQCRLEELQEADARILGLEAEREALQQQIKMLQKDGAELQEWALQGGQDLKLTKELLQSEREMAVSLRSQLTEAERVAEELRKENEHLRHQRSREEEERQELERDAQRRAEAGLQEIAQLRERVEKRRLELIDLQEALERERLERERAEKEAAESRSALLKAREELLALSSNQTQLKREGAENRDALEKMAALNEALVLDKKEMAVRSLQLETELADAAAQLQMLRSEVTALQRELKAVSLETTELRTQRALDMQSLQQIGDRERDLEGEKEEIEEEMSLLREARERDAQKLEELSDLHSSVCAEMRVAQAELSRAVEQQSRAERERDGLLREGQRQEGVVRALEKEKEELELERGELR